MYSEQLALIAIDDDTETGTHAIPVLYRCHPCERTTRRAHVWRLTIRSTARAEHTHPHAHPCPTCRRLTQGAPISGTYSASRHCDDRCMYAKGPDCECACGGKNHGKGYAISLDSFTSR